MIRWRLTTRGRFRTCANTSVRRPRDWRLWTLSLSSSIRKFFEFLHKFQNGQPIEFFHQNKLAHEIKSHYHWHLSYVALRKLILSQLNSRFSIFLHISTQSYLAFYRLEKCMQCFIIIATRNPRNIFNALLIQPIFLSLFNYRSNFFRDVITHPTSQSNVFLSLWFGTDPVSETKNEVALISSYKNKSSSYYISKTRLL